MTQTMEKTEPLLRQAWLEIDTQALSDNFLKIRAMAGKDRQIMAVVKADAYGHGMAETVEVLRRAGADQYAVATVEEGLALRRLGAEEPILILGPLGPEGWETAVRFHLAPAVFSLEQAQGIHRLAEQCRTVAPVHIKLNTGMNRLGFALNDQSLEQIKSIFAMPHLQVAGVFSHFAEADSSPEFTEKQFSAFTSFIGRCGEQGLHFPLAHIANSAAILDYPQTYLDMVRPGIILYGCPPDAGSRDIGLRPVLSLHARISQIHRLQPGEGAGYGRIRRLDRPCLVADIPLGYADGVPRLISERGWVLVEGRRAPLAGRVCMDQMLIDVSDIPQAAPGSLATLIGQQGGESISATTFAAWADTISYEVLTHLRLRLPKIYR
ncbi:MAG: alanine racemase [Firmicutes bacterium]|nr:alanine racemase [Bacillota bacterium]